jgi:uncharacterized protein YbbC (DUF1343 family)
VRVRSGLEVVVTDQASRIRGRRVGLVAHPASVDSRYRSSAECIVEAGAELVAIFGPEHGFAGDAQDMIAVSGESGPRGVRVHSLYGASESDLSPKREWLEDLDAIVVDLQDVGSRYYTFVWTAALVLRAASSAGVETVILDRPNPLGGDVIEGRPQRPGYLSFVGLYDVAVRHGMTIGEIVTMVRARERIDEAALHVVRMDGYSRSMSYEETGFPWVMPSPNMPTLETARVYPGGCLVEGTRMSEGRGTTRPFEMFGAPGLDGAGLARDVLLDGALLRPIQLRPTFHKHAGKLIGGVQVHVTDAARFRPYEAYLRMIAWALSSVPADERWRTEEYEYVTDRPAIDLLTGGPEFRRLVDAGESLEGFLEDERRGADSFAETRRESLLYR